MTHTSDIPPAEDRRVGRRRFISGLGSASLLSVRGRTAFAADGSDPAFGDAPSFPGQRAYEDRRRDLVWQAIKPDRYPAEIVSAQSEADIARAVAAARSTGRGLSVVSGAHSYIGCGLQNGTLLLDLSRLKGMQVDSRNRIGTVEPGLRVGDFEAALSVAGMAFPIGHDPHVGLGGYLLGGGLGWNPDSWNSAACFNIQAVDVVLASGQTVRADASSHPDLLWAARGGGPNFPGIVSRFHVGLFPRPRAIRESLYTYELHRVGDVVSWLERLSAKQTDKMEVSLTLAAESGTGPGGTGRRICSVSLIYFADSEDEAAALQRIAAEAGPPANAIRSDVLAKRHFADLLAEDGATERIRHAVETVWTGDPSAAAMAAARRFLSAPSPDTIVYLGYRARQTLPPEEAAFSIYGRSYVFIDAAWRTPADDAANRGWLDALVTDLAPATIGFYINETDWIGRPGNLARCYNPAALERLKTVAAAYDPGGLFPLPLRSYG
jgi:FAD/FMN-containing dehydrogenase